MPPSPSPNSSAWNWPAEWAVERAFWRDVATRTIAGVLTIILLAVPGLIYAGIYGLLTPAQVAPILIGIACFAAVIMSYLFVLWAIRLTTRRKIKKTLEREKRHADLTPSLWALFESSQGERDRIMSDFQQSTQNRVRRLVNISHFATAVATAVAAGIAALVPVLGQIQW